jgi:hypothetical protein
MRRLLHSRNSGTRSDGLSDVSTSASPEHGGGADCGTPDQRCVCLPVMNPI